MWDIFLFRRNYLYPQAIWTADLTFWCRMSYFGPLHRIQQEFWEIFVGHWGSLLVRINPRLYGSTNESGTWIHCTLKRPFQWLAMNCGSKPTGNKILCSSNFCVFVRWFLLYTLCRICRTWNYTFFSSFRQYQKPKATIYFKCECFDRN